MGKVAAEIEMGDCRGERDRERERGFRGKFKARERLIEKDGFHGGRCGCGCEGGGGGGGEGKWKKGLEREKRCRFGKVGYGKSEIRGNYG